MFERILLASDPTYEGLVALREGAVLAASFKARVFLLIVDAAAAGANLAGGVHASPVNAEADDLLKRGLARLSALGVRSEGALERGEPVPVISRLARDWKAELVVLGHRRQNLLERWWSGAHGAYLADHVACSVLVARQVVSDAEFEARLRKAGVKGATAV